MNGGVRASLLGLALLLAPLPLSAQPADPPTDAELAAARSLFNEARVLEDQGRWQEALEKLKAVGKVRMTPQVRFHIALCKKNTGNLVAARNGFELARREARKKGAEQVLRESAEHIEALEARIPSLHIQVQDPPAGFSVLIDDEPIHTGLLAVPVPLDPGEHHVRAFAHGHEDFEQVVSLQEGAAEVLTITLRPSKLAPAPTAPTTAPTPPATPPPEPPSQDTTQSDSTLGWVLVGTGGALLVGAAASTMVRSSAIADIDDRCPSHRDCDPALKDTRDRAQTYGTLAAVLGGVGVAAAGTGGFLVWTSSRGHADDTQVAIQPAAQPDGLGMSGTVRW